jgi:hypothetical protein
MPKRAKGAGKVSVHKRFRGLKLIIRARNMKRKRNGVLLPKEEHCTRKQIQRKQIYKEMSRMKQ